MKLKLIYMGSSIVWYKNSSTIKSLTIIYDIIVFISVFPLFKFSRYLIIVTIHKYVSYRHVVLTTINIKLKNKYFYSDIEYHVIIQLCIIIAHSKKNNDNCY